MAFSPASPPPLGSGDEDEDFGGFESVFDRTWDAGTKSVKDRIDIDTSLDLFRQASVEEYPDPALPSPASALPSPASSENIVSNISYADELNIKSDEDVLGNFLILENSSDNFEFEEHGKQPGLFSDNLLENSKSNEVKEANDFFGNTISSENDSFDGFADFSSAYTELRDSANKDEVAVQGTTWTEDESSYKALDSKNGLDNQKDTFYFGANDGERDCLDRDSSDITHPKFVNSSQLDISDSSKVVKEAVDTLPEPDDETIKSREEEGSIVSSLNDLSNQNEVYHSLQSDEHASLALNVGLSNKEVVKPILSIDKQSPLPDSEFGKNYDICSSSSDLVNDNTHLANEFKDVSGADKVYDFHSNGIKIDSNCETLGFSDSNQDFSTENKDSSSCSDLNPKINNSHEISNNRDRLISEVESDSDYGDLSAPNKDREEFTEFTVFDYSEKCASESDDGKENALTPDCRLEVEESDEIFKKSEIELTDHMTDDVQVKSFDIPTDSFEDEFANFGNLNDDYGQINNFHAEFSINDEEPDRVSSKSSNSADSLESDSEVIEEVVEQLQLIPNQTPDQPPEFENDFGEFADFGEFTDHDEQIEDVAEEGKDSDEILKISSKTEDELEFAPEIEKLTVKQESEILDEPPATQDVNLDCDFGEFGEENDMLSEASNAEDDFEFGGFANFDSNLNDTESNLEDSGSGDEFAEFSRQDDSLDEEISSLTSVKSAIFKVPVSINSVIQIFNSHFFLFSNVLNNFVSLKLKYGMTNSFFKRRIIAKLRF